jgi:nitrite reductase/ring-hydroxylating ferredoxin subunit
MVERKFLSTPYGAYLNREVPSEDIELTHVGPGTPGGEYLRRFWQPVGFVADLDDRPRRIRLLGEDLVLFRDGRGQIGLLQVLCPHRGASLEFGRVADRGLRCCYHGWLFDVDGRILETPGESPTSTLKDRLCHGAYPTREHQGLIFAYLGPPDRRPPLPILDVFDLPGYRRIPTSWMWPANWVQIRENAMDPAHTYFLHTTVSGPQFTEQFAAMPEHEWQETPLGMVYIATRRVKDDLVWVRICEVILPNFHQFPSNWNEPSDEQLGVPPMLFDWAVPLDDTHTLVIGYYLQDESADVDVRALLEDVPGQSPHRPYVERQRWPGDYEAQVLGRPISVHALEHLAATDRGVTMFRNLLRRGIRAVRDGDERRLWPSGADGVLSTYAQDSFVRAPVHGADGDADRRLLRELGRKVMAARYLLGRSRSG